MEDFGYCLPYLLQLPHIVPDGRSSQIQFPNRWWYGKRTVLMSTLRKCIHWYISSGDILLCGDFFLGWREFFLKKDHTQCVLHILKPPHLPQAIRYGGQCLAKKVLTAGWMWPQETNLLFYILFVNIKECLIDQSWGLCSHSQRRRILQHSLRQMLWPWWRHQGTEWLIRITDLITY